MYNKTWKSLVIVGILIFYYLAMHVITNQIFWITLYTVMTGYKIIAGSSS